MDRSRLTTRLEDVCKLNHVKIDRSALTKERVNLFYSEVRFIAEDRTDKEIQKTHFTNDKV